MSRARRDAEPETRVGICCGCQRWNSLLFKVPGVYRYRCAPCYRTEQGYDHALCRRVFTVSRVTRQDAGGSLVAPVDQFGIESGDTPSYDGAAVAKRCEELNARQLQPIKHPAGFIPCRCRFANCCIGRGDQLLPGYYCIETTIAP